MRLFLWVRLQPDVIAIARGAFDLTVPLKWDSQQESPQCECSPGGVTSAVAVTSPAFAK
jgi:hypothetical protein